MRSPDDFMQATASSLMEMQERMASLMQQDQDSGAEMGQGAFASFVAPLEINRQRKRQIKALPLAPPRSPNAIWYVHTITEQEDEGLSSTCMVYQIKKEHGSNGLPLAESDGLGMSLAMSALLDPTNSMSSRPPLLLGTIAKACLTPGGPMGFRMPMQSEATSHFDIRPMRPRKILFQTRGELEMIASDLRDLGFKQFDVAESAIVRSLELHNSQMNDAQYATANDHAQDMLRPDHVSMGRQLMATGEAMGEPYVDETCIPLGSWKPPNEPGDLPGRWYCRPPDNPVSFRPTALLGWRTNLERAILREDRARVQDIVSKRNAKDIREFVELRMLLTKCAQRGLVVACKLLLEECGASVEGAQAPDAPSWWLEIQNSSGNCDSLTPLHQACRNGQSEAVKLLIEHHADVNRIDKANIRGSALHHAVSGGQIDCCRILCENGADLTYEGHGGDALQISELIAGRDEYTKRVQEKMQQILREYDSRCSNCQHPNAPKSCPCRKERYCNTQCQKARWKYHKRYHKEIVGDDK